MISKLYDRVIVKVRCKYEQKNWNNKNDYGCHLNRFYLNMW